ncbi:inositol 1,4,5-triphosphate receptor associated 2-like [Crotalus tigris]|uniref:inositol 1,4,5-triphosphate receptor associated 2-like n=1 Tax=Crotalus tigris TaxID=88082 RepID=UPI00192FA5EE|nr:inositol 1,4,5-triphosphate receptor associated 2-like [Crotalus tigris]XP_039179297.1 inositol 1,4,5-triphosphate receptor associated 2-like [Crotalus tigris]XP_039179298.1 inositol 1,4,5-triphosphate receptor associated 2-like [Crotalus tigris]XP_039179299.1 inositol 1,4,5-triphosphate receptor associated 2-like [Crotalus tigris]
MQIQHLGDLDGPVLTLDAEATATSEGESERMVNERTQSSDGQAKLSVVAKRNSVQAVCFKDSGDSDEESNSSEDELNTSQVEVSVLQRLGLHRTSLTEQDVEAAFAHLALALRCDMFTLKQRVQIEERARNTAEENIQEELAECQAVLQKLEQACLNPRHKELVEHLQNSLAILTRTIERATSAAEKLGAVHQEARMSRAAELMVQHVENLKRHHLREHAELEDMKRLIQQNSRNWQLTENKDDGEQRLKYPLARFFHQGSARRRVSIAVVPRQLTFHSSENEEGLEGEVVKPSIDKDEGSQRQSHFSQEDPAENHVILHPSPSSFSQQSLQAANSSRERSHCAEGRESELRSRSHISKSLENLIEGLGTEEANKECEELEENALLVKRSKLEICRAWFSVPVYYWVSLWMFFLGIACLVLIWILELQKQCSFTASDC